MENVVLRNIILHEVTKDTPQEHPPPNQDFSVFSLFAITLIFAICWIWLNDFIENRGDK